MMKFILVLFCFVSYFYVLKQTPCSSDPCMNNSTCVARYEDDDYYCACAPGISGKNCSDIGDDHITYRNNMFFGKSTSFDQAPSLYTPLTLQCSWFLLLLSALTS